MKRLLLLLAVCALTLGAQTKKILVMGNYDEAIDDWRKVSNKVKLVEVTPDTVMKEIGDADAFIGSIKPEMVMAGKKLKWVQVTSAGVEPVLHMSGSTALRDSDIILTNNQIVQGPEIADHALAMLLSLTREIPRWLALKAEKKWQATPRDLYELRGKTAIVIGVGGIGMQISQRAWAFGMTVIGVDPEDIPFSPFVSRVVKPDQLDDVLPLADVVFMSAPHTEKTNKMIGPNQFERMKKGSWFIAVSRGKTYDLSALIKSLDSGHLKGAGVDVVEREPLESTSALWEFPNVIITPHIAGRSDMDRDRMLGTVKENIRRFAEGLPLLNVVDKQKGY
ncbi:MAG: D-2-hydroxyacid dehydrogenase [Bryobacterales bacterium]